MLLMSLNSGLNVFIEALIAFLIIILICLPIHEFGHAWAAVKLGDTLPLYQGRYTLNPKQHLDPIGTLLLALVGFGWAKPVQFNPYALRKAPNMRAGIIVVAALPFRLGLVSMTGVFAGQPLAVILYTLVTINLVLFVFNLIPVPPLDGSRILFMLLPPQYDNITRALTQYGPFILLAVVLLAGSFISSVTFSLTRFLIGF